MARLLLEGGASVNQRTETFGYTPLMIAIRCADRIASNADSDGEVCAVYSGVLLSSKTRNVVYVVHKINCKIINFGIILR